MWVAQLEGNGIAYTIMSMTEKEHARHFNEFHGGDATLVQIQGIEKVVAPRRGVDDFRILCKRKSFGYFLYNKDSRKFKL